MRGDPTNIYLHRFLKGELPQSVENEAKEALSSSSELADLLSTLVDGSKREFEPSGQMVDNVMRSVRKEKPSILPISSIVEWILSPVVLRFGAALVVFALSFGIFQGFYHEFNNDSPSVTNQAHHSYRDTTERGIRYNDDRVVNSVNALLTYLEGSLGALFLVSLLVLAMVSSVVWLSSGNRRWSMVALLSWIGAVLVFICRSLIATLFN